MHFLPTWMWILIKFKCGDANWKKYRRHRQVNWNSLPQTAYIKITSCDCLWHKMSNLLNNDTMHSFLCPLNWSDNIYFAHLLIWQNMSNGQIRLTKWIKTWKRCQINCLCPYIPTFNLDRLQTYCLVVLQMWAGKCNKFVLKITIHFANWMS